MNGNFGKAGAIRQMVFALFVVFAVSTFADPKISKSERQRAVSTLDRMYEKFLSGSLVEARTNILQAIEFTQKNSARIPELEGALPIAYARISLLERKAGNDALSRIYFEKSRYWRIVEREKLKLKPVEIVADHDSFTREESDKYALEWDKKRTKGLGPAYLKETP
jgi:hypothetical protein